MATKKRRKIKKHKEVVIRTSPRIKKHKEVVIRASPRDIHVEKILIENFVSLQKVMTGLSIKFDSLTTQISKLLELFEISAKSLAEKNIEDVKAQDETKQILNKVDSLLDQNKIIARGLTLVHEKMQGTEQEEESFEPEPPIPRRPIEPIIPPRPVKNISPIPPKKSPFEESKDIDLRGYQKSIADI